MRVTTSIFSERLVWYCGQLRVGTACSTTSSDWSSVPAVCGAWVAWSAAWRCPTRYTKLHVVYAWWRPYIYQSRGREYLDVAYPNWWLGRAGPVAWPPRSPDLNPLDFYLWGRLKTLVYATEIPNVTVLQQRIENGCATVRNEVNGPVCNIPRAVRRLPRYYVNLHGRHF